MESALLLYKRHTKAELLEITKAIEADPATQNADQSSIYRFAPKVQIRLANIATAISYHMADERAAAGDPVPTSGYSGRQTNRRGR